MYALDVLEVVASFGSIIAVWFVLIGWKLLPCVLGRSSSVRPRSGT